MPYTQFISRANKACFVFLLDQSYSMSKRLGGTSLRKMEELAMAINEWLVNMVLCATGDDEIKDWMDVAVIGYSSDQGNSIVEPAILGALAGRQLVSIKDIAEHPAELKKVVEEIIDEETGIKTPLECEIPVWVAPVAQGSAPMCHALLHCYELLKPWVESHPTSHPPIVIHFTNGESSDGDPTPYAESVCALATQDGNVLLCNCHLSETALDPFAYPSSDKVFKDEKVRSRFRMSSVIPEAIYNRMGTVRGDADLIRSNSRCMAVNGSMTDLLRLLNMGTVKLR